MADPVDGDVIFCYGNAKPTDTLLASTVHCIDDEIVGWLERRDRRDRQGLPGGNPPRRNKSASAANKIARRDAARTTIVEVTR